MSYAVRALAHLARQDDDRAILSSVIANSESMPKPYLSKVLTELKSAGFVTGTKGPNGGFRLARDPSDIRLFDLFVLFEGFHLADSCLLGLGQCGEVANCPVHEKWIFAKSQLESYLRGTTIAMIADSNSRD